MNRKKGSDRPRSVTTEESTDLTEELIWSLEEATHTHLAPRKIAEETGISRSSISQFKRLKTPEMSDGSRNRRYARAIALAEKFERNSRMIEKRVRQDEKDFTTDFPINL